MKRALPGLVGALAVLAVMLGTFSVWTAPTEQWVGDGTGDAVSVAWSLDHLAWSVFNGQWPTGHTDRLIFPRGGALAPTALLPGLLLAPLTWALGGVVAYNLLVLIDVGLTAAAGTWAAQRWGALPGPAAAVGLLLAGSPVMVAALTNQNPDAAGLYGVPLVVGLVARETSALAKGAVAGLMAWVSPYTGVMAGLAGMLLPVRCWPRFGVGVLVTGIPFFVMVRDTLGVGTVVGQKVGVPASTSLMALAVPGVPLMPVKQSAVLVADGAYLGLLLVPVGLWALTRSGGLRWAALAAVGLLLALGPQLELAPGRPLGLPLPGVLWAEAPGLGQLRLTSRFTFLVLLALALAWATTRHRWQGVLGALLVFDLAVLPGGWWRLGGSEVVDGADRAAVASVDAPVLYLGNERRDHGLRVGLLTRQPVSEGIKMGMPPFVWTALRAKRDMPTWARQQGYGWLVVERGAIDELGARGLGGCAFVDGERWRVAALESCTP